MKSIRLISEPHRVNEVTRAPAPGRGVSIPAMVGTAMRRLHFAPTGVVGPDGREVWRPTTPKT